MGFNGKVSILLFQLLTFIQLQLIIRADFETLENCAKHKSCWPNLDNEIIDIIHSNIRNKTERCDNFWYYACGAWKPPSGTHHVDNFGIAVERYEKRLKTFFEINLESLQYFDEKNYLKDLLNNLNLYYKSCKHVKSDLNPIIQYLNEIKYHLKINWPNWRNLLESDERQQKLLSSNFNWLTTIAALRRFGLNDVIFRERATTAFNDAEKYVIELNIPNIGDGDGFQKPFEFVNYFVDFELIDGVTDKIWDIAADIFELETQLKDLRVKHQRDNTNASLEQSLSLNELKSQIPYIDWQLYFNVLLNQAHVVGTTPIELNGIDYFKDVAALLTQTDEKIIAFYVLMHFGKYLHEIQTPQTANRCISHMNVIMPLGMNFVYDKFLYETRAQDEIALYTIFNKLKVQFSKYLNNNKLNLNKFEKLYLQEKVDNMILRLGNLPLQPNTNYYNHYYNTANIIANNFYHNHLELLEFRFKTQHIGFESAQENIVDRKTFYIYDDITQMRTAPYFVHEQNLLLVPMVFMQLPFFHHSLSTLLQQSLVGFILGHEFNHAFEYEGIITDAMGSENSIGFNIRNKLEFKEHLKCFQQTPTASLVERMADVNGFQLAYDAYFNGNDEINENDFNENTLEYKGNLFAQQLFFLNFAQFFCGHLPTPIDHDRDDVRVNVIVKNMPEFERAFQCSRKSVNNNKFKFCQMWRT